jgi:DNA-binding IscR family transcriptional regulator
MADGVEDADPAPDSKLVEQVIHPLVEKAGQHFLAQLDAVTVDDLCRESGNKGVFEGMVAGADFTI